MEHEGKNVSRKSVPTLQFTFNVLQGKRWMVQGVHLTPNNKWYQSQMGAIKDLLSEREEWLKRKRVSRFVLPPGALRHSNYYIAVKKHSSSSHWDNLRCFPHHTCIDILAVYTSNKTNNDFITHKIMLNRKSTQYYEAVHIFKNKKIKKKLVLTRS